VYDLARNHYGARAPIVFWFCWSNGMVNPFGVVDRAGRQKAAYVRYRALAH
jgi:hypothetical protein